MVDKCVLRFFSLSRLFPSRSLAGGWAWSPSEQGRAGQGVTEGWCKVKWALIDCQGDKVMGIL